MLVTMGVMVVIMVVMMMVVMIIMMVVNGRAKKKYVGFRFPDPT
jgi:amino acid permease